MRRAGRATEGKCTVLFGECGYANCARSIRAGEQKKVATAAQKSFPSSPARSGGEHLGALACGAAFGEEGQAPGAARTGVAEEGSTRSKRLQPSVDNRLQRLVSHGRWAALRAADSARSFQPLCAFGGALAQPKRYRCAPSSGAGFSSLRPAQSDSGRQRRTLWWQRRSGVVALERVVVALGHRGGVCPASSPRGQRCARTNASGVQSRCSRSTRSQRSGTETAHPSLDWLLQPRASARSLGPARACADVLAEQSAHAGAVAKSEISVRVEDKESAQPGTYQMARQRTLCWTGLCWATGRTQQGGQGYPRSLSRSSFHWVALRARSGRDATGLHRASSVRLSACPPLQSKRAACERAPEQTAAPPSSYLASLFRRAEPPKCKSVTHVMRSKCYPCHETVPAACAPQIQNPRKQNAGCRSCESSSGIAVDVQQRLNCALP
jgi:hypothetical protein